jgi:ribonuclease P protein component
LLVHLVRTGSDEDSSPRVGFIVSRAVGGAVVRNRVLRRLRHLMATRLDVLPPGSRLVVRALPPAADASSAELGQALDYAVAAAARRGERDAAVRPPVAP